MAEERPSTTNLITSFTEITFASIHTTTTIPTNPNFQQNDDVNSLASSSSSMSRAPSPPPAATDNTSEEGQGGEQLACTPCGQIGHVSRYCPDQVWEKCHLRGHAGVDCIGCCNCGSLQHNLPDCERLDH
ncbi:hypothetical protein Tco_1529295, partial [Tanacetum coccineum]